ncbi:MAG: hypothetical protein QM757_15285 [Paludibaculum sp.]
MVTINLLLVLRGSIDQTGKKRFPGWLEHLDPVAAAKVAIALTRMEHGNFSNTKSVGSGSSNTGWTSALATGSILAGMVTR